MRQDATHISIVLDRSGSMAAVAADTIGGFNRFLADQKAAPGSATLTLAQFDNVYEVVHDAKPVAEVPALDSGTFVPRGGTALLDAVGRTIIGTGTALAAMPDDQRPAKVVFVIITDGQENASHEFTREKVLEMISHQREKYAWEFVFLGANQDAIAAGASIGVGASNSLTYASNAVGTGAAFASVSSNTTRYRSGEVKTAGFVAADRDQQTQAGAQS